MDLPQEVVTLVQDALDPTVVVDRNLGLVAFNRGFVEATGLRPRELKGNTTGLCHKVFGLTCCADEAGCLALRAFDNGRMFREVEVLATLKNLRFIVSAFPLKNPSGEVYAVFEQYRDVTAENRVQEEYKRLYESEQARSRALDAELSLVAEVARTDALTGVANRRSYDTQIGLMLETAKHRRSPLSLVIFDLDFFKRVNDQFGHPEGDLLLQAFAGVLKVSARDDDLVARVGGEEFVLVLPGAGPADALMVASRVQEKMRQAGLRTTASGGIACFPDDGLTPADLYRVADQALYAAKHAGRNRVLLSTAGLELHESSGGGEQSGSTP